MPRTPLRHAAARAAATVAAVLSGLTLLLGATLAATPAAADNHVLLSDDFSAGAGQWSTSGGSWATSGQSYQQSGSSGNARAFAGDASWSDVTVQAAVTPQSGSGSSSLSALLGRVQNTDTYYYLTLRNNNRLEINKLVSGSRTELAGTSFTVSAGTTYTLALEMWADDLTGYVNGQPLVSASDSQLGTGRVGLKTFNATAAFGNVVVTEQVDTEPPTVPTNLRVTGTSSSSVDLAWNPSTDNDQVARYEVYRAGSPATLAGSTTGATSLLVTDLSPQTSYQFYVVAVDRSGNSSPASSTVSATTTQQPSQPPVEQPVGYASLNGGTTGGFGHEVVHEVVLSQYWAASDYPDPGEAMYQRIREHRNQPANEGLVIYVDLTIHEDNFGRSKLDITDAQNVSILGVGNQGELHGVGWTVRRAHNVVFRNLTIHHVRQGEGTAIEVTDDSTNIWIDHNEFYSEYENAPDKDYYDGLVDIKRNAEYVTVSWNYFHDHWKTMLLGHTDNESLKPDKITYMNNWFRNVESRLPLIRYAEVHMLNNYFQDVHDTAVNARMGAQVLVEGNYFQNVGSGQPDPTTGFIKGPVGWFYGSSQTGYWNLVGNVFVNTPHEHLESTTNFTVPYQYQAQSATEARDLVVQFAGVGVINVSP